MWIDYAENIYRYGKCDSITKEYTQNTNTDLERILPFFIGFKVLDAIPLTIFASFIIVSLTYRSMISLFELIFTYKFKEKREDLIEKSRDSFCCLFCNADDENELIYSKCDLDYVMDLLNNNVDLEQEKKDQSFQIIDTKSFDKTHHYTLLKRLKRSKFMEILKKIGNFIYKWDENFKFSSRYVNSLFVALVTLYYFSVYWGYVVITNVTGWTLVLPDSTSEINLKDFDFGALLCGISDEICVEQIKSFKFILPFQRAINFINDYKSHINSILIVPVFGALLITLVQVLLWVKESKTHLKQLYKGNCEFVAKAKNLTNQSIATKSYSFGG